VAWLVWAAARLAAALTGGRAEPFGAKFADDVVRGRTYLAWPHTPTVAVTAAAIVLAGGAAALAGTAGWLILRRRPAAGDPVAALARNPRMRALTARPAAPRPPCAGPWPEPTRAPSTPRRPGSRSAG
jgi:hypothetical protein